MVTMETTKSFIRNRWGLIVCVSGFFVCCGILSPVNSYGVLFTEIQMELNATTVQIGWVGSLSWSFSFLAGPLAVVIERRIGHVAATVLGCLFTSCCYLIASFVSSYAGFLVFYGIIAGTSIGVALHSILCVIFKIFPPSKQAMATGITLIGSSVGTIFVSLAYEKLVPVFGWRKMLQITFGFSAIFSIPAAFAISPRDQTSSRKRSDTGTVVGKTDEEIFKENSIPSVSGKVDEVKQEHKRESKRTFPKTRWRHLLVSWRAWALFFTICFPAMSWSVYWINSVNYFESISASPDEILLYVTVTTASDFVGRAIVILIPSRFLEAVRTLTFSNLLAVVVTVVFVLYPIKPVIATCCVYIGVGRSWYNIFPLKVAVDLLQVGDSDKGLTLAMMGLGAGFFVGTIPAGAIRDVTGSYTLAFLINSVFYFIGATFLVLLQFCRHRQKRKSSCNDVYESRGSPDEVGIDNRAVEMMES